VKTSVPVSGEVLDERQARGERLCGQLVNDQLKRSGPCGRLCSPAFSSHLLGKQLPGRLVCHYQLINGAEFSRRANSRLPLVLKSPESRRAEAPSLSRIPLSIAESN
jgi:hypothetical protein